MKRLFRSIMFIAAAAITFNSCNVDPVDTDKVSAGTHKVSFIASQAETRTTMSDVNGVAKFSWEDADVNYFHIFENGEKAKDYAADINDSGAMEILAEFDRATAASYEYTGFFAPSFSVYPMVPSAQTDEGCYDPMADILLAQPLSTEASQSLESLPLRFKRIVAINKMTLKGLDAGEIVSEVKIESDKPIAGKYDYENERWYNSLDKQITVTASSAVNASGEAVIYFVCAPVENAQLTVTATTTSGKTYSKEFAKTITFAEAGVKYFGVTMEEADAESVDVVFGTLGYESWGKTEYFSGDTVASVTQTVGNVKFDYVKNSGSCYANTGSIRFYKSNELTFTAPDGYYITNIEWTGTKFLDDATTDAGICSSTTTNLSWEGQAYAVTFTRPSGASSYMTLSGVTVTLVPGTIKLVSATGVALDKNALSLTVGDQASLVATVSPADASNKSVTWTSDKESVATVSNGVVTAKAEGTATITVTTSDGGFTATCSVTVKAAPVKTYSNLAALIADGEPTDTGRPVTVTLTNEKIESIYVNAQGYRNGIYLVVPDKTVEIYCRNVPDTWNAFGTVSGTLINCTWKNYNGTWELCPEDWSELSYTAPVMYDIAIPTGIAHGSVTADASSAPQGAVVTLTATPASGYQFSSWTVKDASNNVITVTNNKFTMPASDVTVAATFTPVSASASWYEKVTSTSAITDGKYLIVCESASVALDGSLSTIDAAGNTVSVTVNGGKIYSTTDIDAAAFTYSATNGTLLGNSGKYIYHTGSKNTLNSATTPTAVTVSIDADGNVVIDGGSSYKLRYNASSGQDRFRFYTSGQQAIQLYKYIAN